MAEIFIISDTHFDHASMLSFRRADGTLLRDFPSVDVMNEHMVERWNSVVRPKDKVYHLGDVAKKKSLHWMARCNGHKRILLGNHDEEGAKKYLLYFEEIYASRLLDHMLFTHIPVHPASIGKNIGNVHGHIHVPPQDVYGCRYLNMSVEVIDYTPVPLEEVKKRLLEKIEDEKLLRVVE
jgi:calcineurin-like phosphoesterase family protein